MAHSELDLRERRRIEDMLRAKVPVDEIAVALGRHRSTIYREIVRNRFVDAELPYLAGYWGVVAQNKAVARRARRCKLIRPAALLDAVVDRLKAGWSPGQIAGRLRSEGQAVTVSHETIYAHFYSREGRAAELARHLPVGGGSAGPALQDGRKALYFLPSAPSRTVQPGSRNAPSLATGVIS